MNPPEVSPMWIVASAREQTQAQRKQLRILIHKGRHDKVTDNMPRGWEKHSLIICQEFPNASFWVLAPAVKRYKEQQLTKQSVIWVMVAKKLVVVTSLALGVCLLKMLAQVL